MVSRSRDMQLLEMWERSLHFANERLQLIYELYFFPRIFDRELNPGLIGVFSIHSYCPAAS